MKIRIEQTLHGYYKGHGLLASSVPSLEQADASLMSTLSDWTGYRGNSEEEDNYLTVYPLLSGKYMAFAKTWYAKEMERPGCVWTHTLLVPIDTFKDSFDVRNLMQFFKRPQNSLYDEYNLPLDLDTELLYKYENQPIFNNFDMVSVLFLLSVLLGGFKGAYFGISGKQADLQLLLLSLLQYLPLGILKETSVSSGSERARRIGKEEFSLQFVSGLGGETLENGSWRANLTESSFTSGLYYLCHEACQKNDNSSYLIHIFNEDIGKSNIKYEAVVNLLRLLDVAVTGSEDVPYEKVLSYIYGAFPKSEEGMLVKANFLSKKVSNIFCSDSECLKKIAQQNIEEGDWKYVQLSERLSNISHSDLLSIAISLAVHNRITETPCLLLKYAFEILDAAEINGILEYKWNQLKHLVIGNETYIKNDYWLYLKKELFNEFFPLLPNGYVASFKKWNLLLKLALSYGTHVNERWAEEIVNHAESSIHEILSYASLNGLEHIADSLLKNCFLHVKECLDWMNEQENGFESDFFLDLITTRLDPYSRELRDYPLPFWQCLLKSNSKTPSFLSFIFVLAFQKNENDCLELLRKSFDDIYILQSKNRFPEYYWNRIAFYVDTISWVKDWDKCKRLCLFVIEFLHQKGYGKEVIKSISKNRSIRERLQKIWKKLYQ